MNEDVANPLFALYDGVAESENDPEDACLMALGRRDISLILWSFAIGSRMAPEYDPAIRDFLERLGELARAQDFID